MRTDEALHESSSPSMPSEKPPSVRRPSSRPSADKIHAHEIALAVRNGIKLGGSLLITWSVALIVQLPDPRSSRSHAGGALWLRRELRRDVHRPHRARHRDVRRQGDLGPTLARIGLRRWRVRRARRAIWRAHGRDDGDPQAHRANGRDLADRRRLRDDPVLHRHQPDARRHSAGDLEGREAGDLERRRQGRSGAAACSWLSTTTRRSRSWRSRCSWASCSGSPSSCRRRASRRACAIASI